MDNPFYKIVVAIITFLAIYILVLKPAILKREYLSCVDQARKSDYTRWYDIEKEIEDRDIFIKQQGRDADSRYSKFLEDNASEESFQQCCTNLERDCSAERGAFTLAAIRCEKCQNDKFNFCAPQVRDVIYKEVREAQQDLRDLYQKRDDNGALLEQDLINCKERFDLFGR